MGSIDLSSVRSCWGNSNFDYVHSDSVGNSGGILCIWDPNSFRRSSFTRSDYFVIVRGVWLKSGIDLMIVVVYAPQEAKEKRMLWDYLAHVSNQWVGKLVMMGDFNEVRYKSDRYGSNFNAHDAEIFNSFIYNAGLDEVPLGGSAYTCPIPFPILSLSGWKLMVLIRSDSPEVRSFSFNRGVAGLVMSFDKVGVLGDLVNEVQSAFVANRQILDGPFILDEVLQWCRRKKKHALIFNSDFEKAFDSVHWDFMDDVLNKFGYLWRTGNLNKVVSGGSANAADIDISRNLGKWENTRFWLDNWYEGGVIKELFPRMFALELNKNATTLESDGVLSVAAILQKGRFMGNRFQDVSLRIGGFKSVPIKVLRKISSGWILGLFGFVNSYKELASFGWFSFRIQSELQGVLVGVITMVCGVYVELSQQAFCLIRRS
ncbi:RNA-directed DNA polymerase, eukaryota [Tanacetum coccineum]